VIPYAENLTEKEQTAFMKGKNIRSGILALHEVIHETKRKKDVGVVLKLDFEKAYGKVNWSFLLSCIRNRGFSEKWCG
jgi:hypothetical protein